MAKGKPPRQRPIPVTAQERADLERLRAEYNQGIGDTGDWGDFLRAMSLLGLVGLGIYALAKATTRTGQTVNVSCSNCSGTFPLALSMNAPRYVEVTCPHCSRHLVVDLNPPM